jgi:hypothetical protein
VQLLLKKESSTQRNNEVTKEVGGSAGLFLLTQFEGIASCTLAGCGNVAAKDAKFAGGGAHFVQRLIELGNVACLDVDKKLIFPRVAMNRTAFNLEEIDTVPGKRLE